MTTSFSYPQTKTIDLTITAPTMTFSYTPTASPSITVITVPASAQETTVVTLNQQCSPQVLALRSREVDPYQSSLVNGQIVIDQSGSTFVDINSCCSVIAALDGAVGFTYYQSGVFQGLCRGTLVDPNGDSMACSASSAPSYLVDVLSPGSGVVDGMLQCASNFGLPPLP